MVPIGFPLGYGRWGHAYANCLNCRFLCVCLHYGLWGIKEQPQPWDGQVAPCSYRVSWMSHRPGGDWMRSLWIPSNLRCSMIRWLTCLWLWMGSIELEQERTSAYPGAWTLPPTISTPLYLKGHEAAPVPVRASHSGGEAAENCSFPCCACLGDPSREVECADPWRAVQGQGWCWGSARGR